MNIKKILSIPRSVILNIKLFGLKGLKCPILIANDIKVKGFKNGAVEIMEMKPFSVTVGFRGGRGLTLNDGYLLIGKEAKLIFKGNDHLSQGVSIRVDEGTMTIGENFNCNSNCFFSCTERIDIGNDVLFGWNVNVRDSDGHTIIQNGKDKSSLKPVKIGNHVWLASYVDILKGTEIPNDCVVGYRSLVTRKFEEPNCVIAGCPAQIVNQDIEWRE